MRSALRAWLARPHARAGILGIASLLVAPALSTGLIADDFFHALVLTGTGDIEAIPHDPAALFSWADGDRARAHAMMEVGMTGWWTDPDMVMSYLRPVTTLTHQLDFALWPDTPWLMHLHSLLWFLCALGFAGVLYARLAPAGHAWVGALALALYAFDDAHGMTVAWVANRNALVALALALAVLVLHEQAARTGQRLLTLASALLLGLALLAGEAALGITAYLFAYAACVDPRGKRAGLLAITPHAAVGLAWALTYRALGYGARGSGLVVDPGQEPLRFLSLLAERLPVLLSGQLALPPTDPWEFYPALGAWIQPAVLAWAALLIGGVLLLCRPLLRASPSARMWALGAVLSAIPVCAQFPHDRLLLFVGVGGAGLVAELLAWTLWQTPLAAQPAARLARGAGWALFGVHLVLAPLWLPLRVRAPADVDRMIGAADASIDSDPDVVRRTVVLVNPPIDAYAGYIPPMRAATGRPRPRALRWLATGASELTIRRLDARSLEVVPAAGFLSLASERMQRRKPFAVGDTVALSDLSVRVDAVTADGRPARVTVRFSDPLEDPRYRFRYWGGKAFQPWPLPPIGESATLPRADFVSLLP
jgi:hypothetical protein